MKRLLHTKFRAGILPLVLVISLIMASLCSMMLLLAYYHLHYSKSQSIKSKLQLNLSSALQLGLSQPKDLPLGEWNWFDLYGQGVDSVGILRAPWGCYELVQLKASQGAHTLSKAVLVGNSPPADAAALYVAYQYSIVNLAGDALIRGNAYLPKGYAKAGYVGRYGFYGSALVHGKVFSSKEALPGSDDEYATYLRQLFSAKPAASLPLDSLSGSIEVSYSHAEVAFFHSDAPLRIGNGQRVSGKVVVRSDKRIMVSREAQIAGAILVAPIIELEEGFSGEVQLFASDSIMIRKNVHLLYPSAVGVLQKKEGAFLEVESGARIEGSVFLIPDKAYEHKGFAFFHPKSLVMGQAYIDGTARHEGVIHGSLWVNRFFAQTTSTSQADFLFNGQIDREQLSKQYVGSALLIPNGPRKLLAYLQ